MENKSEELQRVKSFLSFVKSKKTVLFLFTFIGLLIGITYSIVKKPVYTAALTFTLQEESKMGGGGLMSLASSFGLDVGSTSGLFSGDNIEQVFKSRKIIEKTLFQTYPKNNKSFGDNFLTFQQIYPNHKFEENLISINKPSRLRDSLVTEIYKFLNKGYLNILRPDKKYDIYEITMKSTNEEFVYYFTNELLNQVSIFYTETKIKKLKSNVDVLQNRVDSIHRALGGSLYTRAQKTILNLNPVFQTAKVPEQIKSMDVNALGAGYGELLKNLELAKYTLLKETPLFQIVDEPTFPLKKKEFKMWLYAPLGTFLFFLLAIGILVFYKIIKNVITSLK